MSAWQPEQAKLDQVGQLLTACQDVSNHDHHLQALNMLEEGKKTYPDFGCYLLVVFCKMPGAAPQLKHLAGIQLKNAI
jgi:alpha-D-ribose 1-methylphosphonate 5-triphosphate synthase subunit PhnH